VKRVKLAGVAVSRLFAARAFVSLTLKSSAGVTPNAPTRGKGFALNPWMPVE
jgi:hypothetical protein